MDPKIQFRTAFDFRETGTEDVPGFEGYASTFWAADSYLTAMVPGAFKKSIRERADKIPVLRNHDVDTPIGKHLAIKEDKTGLYVNIGIADDGAEGTTFLKRMRFGVPFGMSFGFQTIKDRSAEDDDPIDLSQTPSAKKSDIRLITEVKYWESSPVTFAANEAATITAMRSVLITERMAETLPPLLDAIKAGTLSDEDRALTEQIVAAWGERAEAAAEEQHSTPEQARRRYAEFNALLFKCDLVQEMIR